MNTKQNVGKTGEILAKEYLEKLGYKILETNKHFSKNCEIDIIAQEKECIVFVEVKTRSTDFCGMPLEAITKNKFSNIKMGAFSYLQEHKFKNFRIDAI